MKSWHKRESDGLRIEHTRTVIRTGQGIPPGETRALFEWIEDGAHVSLDLRGPRGETLKGRFLYRNAPSDLAEGEWLPPVDGSDDLQVTWWSNGETGTFVINIEHEETEA